MGTVPPKKLTPAAPKPGAPKPTPRPQQTQRVLARPRQRVVETEYDLDQDSNRGNLIPQDSRCYNSEIPIRIMRPGIKSKLPHVYRILSTVDPETLDAFLPYRRPDGKLRDFMRQLPATRFTGIDSKITVFLYDPRLVRSQEYDRNQNPYIMLYNKIDNACGAGVAFLGRRKLDIARWFNWHAGRSKDRQKVVISKPDNIWVMQGLAYQTGSMLLAGGKKPLGLRDKDYPTIIELSNAAGISFKELLDKKAETPHATDDDIASQYYYGDPTDLATGLWVRFASQANQHDDLMSDTPKPTAATAAGEEEEPQYEEPSEEDTRGGGGSGGQRDFIKENSFVVSMHDKYRYSSNGKIYRAPRDLTEYNDRLLSRFVWWDDILRFPSHEELCLMIARAFKSQPAIIEYAWADAPEYLNDEVLGVIRSRTSEAFPSDAEEEGGPPASGRRRATSLQPTDDEAAEEAAFEEEGEGVEEGVEEGQEEPVEEAAPEGEGEEEIMEEAPQPARRPAGRPQPAQAARAAADQRASRRAPATPWEDEQPAAPAKPVLKPKPTLQPKPVLKPRPPAR